MDHPNDQRYRSTPATMPGQTARFEVDAVKARAFVCRALRRYNNSLADGEGEGAGRGETWTLKPGWNLATIFGDETGHVENLVYEAIHEAGAITCPTRGVDVELLIETPLGGDWMYQWRVSLPTGTGFALCSPYREGFHHIGWPDDNIKAKGCRAALGILHEAVTAGNEILAAYTGTGGRIPAGTT